MKFERPPHSATPEADSRLNSGTDPVPGGSKPNGQKWRRKPPLGPQKRLWARLSVLLVIGFVPVAATVARRGSTGFDLPLPPSAMFDAIRSAGSQGSARKPPPPSVPGEPRREPDPGAAAPGPAAPGPGVPDQLVPDHFAVKNPRTRAALSFGPMDGVTLGLFSQDPDYDYLPLLKEIQRTGARWVGFSTNNYLEHSDSVEVGIPDDRTVTSGRLRTTIRQARSLGLHVMLFPILLLQTPEDGEWRGTLAPKDLDCWFANYKAWIERLAVLCQEESVELFSIGSEFNSLQGHHEPWSEILAAVRHRYDGLITYSANWDSLDGVSFLEQLDIIGMTTYFSLSDKNDPTVDEMVVAWQKVQRDVAEWRVFHNIPLLFTEVGYPSQDGANQNPWNYYTSEVPDLAEQRDCYEAFYRVWGQDERIVQGVFFYNWFGRGGPKDTGYTPRGKPALDVIQRWFQGSRSRLRLQAPGSAAPPAGKHGSESRPAGDRAPIKTTGDAGKSDSDQG